MGARCRVVIVVLILCAAGAVPVIGAVKTEPVVVAADGDVTLTAHDSDDGDLCMSLRAGERLDEAYCAREEEQEGLVVHPPTACARTRATAPERSLPRTLRQTPSSSSVAVAC